MRKKLLIVITLLIYCTGARPCTTFLLNYNGQLVFGRNYDWLADAGLVCTNQRGMHKTSVKNDDGETISWTSRFGSISFNQYGKEFPTGGMNEEGLVVELMWLDGTIYPPSTDKRPAIGVLQWIQYQLDNCSTIDEVIATDTKLRISITATPLHYLIADAKGNAATIEFLNGKMQVHKGSQLPFPVLTNDTYESSVMSKNKGTYAGNNSLERFSTACNMIQQYKANPGGRSLVDQSFDILKQVSQGDFTKWSIVYDISNKKIWFKTEQFPQLRLLNFSSFDFSCKKESKITDINGPEKGDISSLMVNFSKTLNQRILEKTLVQSSSRIVLTREQKQALSGYPETIHCE